MYPVYIDYRPDHAIETQYVIWVKINTKLLKENIV